MTATTHAAAPAELDAGLVSDVTDILHDLDHEHCDHNACHGTPRSTYEGFARAFLPDVLDTVRGHLLDRLTARLRDAAERTLADGGTHQDPLAAHLWASCRRDATGAILDDPRNIAHAAYVHVATRLTEENR